jgi:hypothetical protein
MNAPENRFLHAAVNIKKPLRITVVTETYPPDINGVAHTLSKNCASTDIEWSYSLLGPSSTCLA